MNYTTFVLSDRFDEAFLLASTLHRAQKRKNIPAPFMAHLFSVAALVCENIGFVCSDPKQAEEYVITAILHDTIEDQGGQKTYELLTEKFGKQIADNVLMLSDAFPDEYGNKLPKSERNRLYLEKMESAPQGIVVISCCDKIHNLRTMVADAMVADSLDSFWNAFTLKPEPTVANYQKLLNHYIARLGADNRLIGLYTDALKQVELLLD